MRKNEATRIFGFSNVGINNVLDRCYMRMISKMDMGFTVFMNVLSRQWCHIDWILTAHLA